MERVSSEGPLVKPTTRGYISDGVAGKVDLSEQMLGQSAVLKAMKRCEYEIRMTPYTWLQQLIFKRLYYFAHSMRGSAIHHDAEKYNKQRSLTMIVMSCSLYSINLAAYENEQWKAPRMWRHKTRVQGDGMDFLQNDDDMKDKYQKGLSDEKELFCPRTGGSLQVSKEAL